MKKEPGHVVHLHTSREWGGGEHQILRLVRGLIDSGMKTTVFANGKGKLFEQLVENGLPAVALPKMALTPLLPGFLSGFCRAVRNLDADIIHAHDSLAATIGIGTARRTDIPLVLSRRIASPLRKNPFSRAKYSPERIAGVIAISQTVKDVFAQGGYPLDRIWVVPDGVDVAALDKVELDMEFRIGFAGCHIVGGVGKLSSKKNWNFMARVAERLDACGMDIHWCLAGDGPERPNLEKLVRRLGISSRFHFLGFRTDVTRILKSLDALFFPSLMEGASVTVLEAMVLGTPVVAVNAPGTMETLAGNCWIVNPGDVEVGARSVMEALREKVKRDAVISTARESARSRFPLNLTIEGTMKVYRQVFIQRRGTGLSNHES